jgi:hypothetical protein
MRVLWYKLFVEHPRSVNESYLQHMGKALGIAWSLTFFCVIPVLIHSVVPGWYTTTASTNLFSLTNFLKKRRGIE